MFASFCWDDAYVMHPLSYAFSRIKSLMKWDCTYVHIFSYFFRIRMDSLADTALTCLSVCLILRKRHISFFETRGTYTGNELTILAKLCSSFMKCHEDIQYRALEGQHETKQAGVSFPFFPPPCIQTCIHFSCFIKNTVKLKPNQTVNICQVPFIVWCLNLSLYRHVLMPSHTAHTAVCFRRAVYPEETETIRQFLSTWFKPDKHFITDNQKGFNAVSCYL